MSVRDQLIVSGCLVVRSIPDQFDLVRDRLKRADLLSSGFLVVFRFFCAIARGVLDLVRDRLKRAHLLSLGYRFFVLRNLVRNQQRADLFSSSVFCFVVVKSFSCSPDAFRSVPVGLLLPRLAQSCARSPLTCRPVIAGLVFRRSARYCP